MRYLINEVHQWMRTAGMRTVTQNVRSPPFPPPNPNHHALGAAIPGSSHPWDGGSHPWGQPLNETKLCFKNLNLSRNQPILCHHMQRLASAMVKQTMLRNNITNQ
jgi:hypothetical protein